MSARLSRQAGGIGRPWSAPLRLKLWVMVGALLGSSSVYSLDNDGVRFRTQSEPITPLPVVQPGDPGKRRLGRQLFFDPGLSFDGRRSCADCHRFPPVGMAGEPVEAQYKRLPSSSVAVAGGLGARASAQRDVPLLYNLAHHYWFNWDGRYRRLEPLIEDALDDPVKLGRNGAQLSAELKASYRDQSRTLYQQDLGRAQVVDALAEFLRSLNTLNAPFDRYLRGDLEALSPRQRQGYQLFKQIGCSHCHNGRGIGGNFFERVYIYNPRGDDGSEAARLRDQGRFYVTGEEGDRNSFRVPSLRNVAVSAPYFHDGSIARLDQAVVSMARYQLGMELSDQQVELLVDFLHSLTGIHPGVESSLELR